MKRFAFIMDPLARLDLPWDTSLCLVRELARRGHQNFHFLDSALFSDGHVKGWGRLLQPLGGSRYAQGPLKKFNMADFDGVLIRKDPPFNARYLTLTYLLEPLIKQTAVINNPRGIRNANEKLFGLLLAKWSPPSLIASNPEEIKVFQKKLGSDVVVKPLYEKGGKGIFLLPFRRDRVKTHLYRRLGSKHLLVQKFIPLSRGRGDKRILLWKGTVLGAFERIPKRGEFRTNLSLGARFFPCRVTTTEQELVQDLRPFLIKEGLDFVGIDVREGKLIEVNVTSPAGLVELDKLYQKGATARLADALEKL